MIEYIITVGEFNNLNKYELRLLRTLKRRCNHLIIGTINNHDSNNLKHYCDHVFEVDKNNPSQSIKLYLQNYIQNYKIIKIGKSKNSVKKIKINDYSGPLYFHNKDFRYSYLNENLIVEKENNNLGWDQNLLAYTKSIVFYRHDFNINFKFLFYFKDLFFSRDLAIKKLKPLPFLHQIVDGKLSNLKVDWIVGWINPNLINKFKNVNIQRVRDNNELLYCLKSLYKYAPWINKIYIILANTSSPPVWFKKCDKIRLIQETSLYNPIQKNSETKKLFYANIPGLCEHFIAGDDDYLLGNYIFKKQFFLKNGTPIINSVHMDYDGKAHIPISWTKTAYNQAIDNMTSSQMKLFRTMNTKRENPWIFIKEYMCENQLAVKGKKTKPDCWIYSGNLHQYQKLFIFIKKFRPQFICINDDWDTKNKYNYNWQIINLNNFYKSFYPGRYPFQRF